jgi:hypothetical protein
VWNKLETNLKGISFYNIFKKLTKQHFTLNSVTNTYIDSEITLSSCRQSRVGSSEVVVVRYCSELQFSSGQ